MVFVLLFALFPLFSVCLSSAGLSTHVRYGNVSGYSLYPGKCTRILLGCIENRLYILVIREPVHTLTLGTVYLPSCALYLEYIRICKSPHLDTLWIRLGDDLVNGAEPGLEQLRTGTVYKPRLDTHLNG